MVTYKQIALRYEVHERLYDRKLGFDTIRAGGASEPNSDLTLPAVIELLIEHGTVPVEAVKNFHPKSKRGRPRKFWLDNVRDHGKPESSPDAGR